MIYQISQHEESGENREWEVDAYIDHRELDELIRKRVGEHWRSFTLLTCKPKDDRDYVTIIWYREEK